MVESGLLDWFLACGEVIGSLVTVPGLPQASAEGDQLEAQVIHGKINIFHLKLGKHRNERTWELGLIFYCPVIKNTAHVPCILHGTSRGHVHAQEQ